MNQLEQERQQIIGLRKGDQGSFRSLYTAYAPRLMAFSRKYFLSDADSEEILQEVFIKIWEMKENLDPDKSFSSYVIQAAKHKIFNKFRKKVNEQAYVDFLMHSDHAFENFTERQVEYQEIKSKAEIAISSMPEKRQEIFRLSREEGLKNREIAEKLDISIKTVENQMGQALKFLRRELEAYLPGLVLFVLYLAEF